MQFELAPYCARIYRRKNVGHDFGAYRDVILEPFRPRQAGDAPAHERLGVRAVYVRRSASAESQSQYCRCLGGLRQLGDPLPPSIIFSCFPCPRYLERRFHQLLAKLAVRELSRVDDTVWRGGTYAVPPAAGLRCRALFPYHGITTRTYSSILQTKVLESKLQPKHRQFLLIWSMPLRGAGRSIRRIISGTFSSAITGSRS